MARIAADADIYHALADPTRRQMLRLLAERDHPVMDLVDSFAMKQPSVSEHLRVLRQVGLVKTRPAGRQRIYSLEAHRLKEVAEWLAAFEQFWEDKRPPLDGYRATSRPPSRELSMEID